MSKIVFLLILFVFTNIIFVSIFYSHSFFTSNASNMANSYIAAASFPTGSSPTITVSTTVSPSVTPSLTPIPGYIVLNELIPQASDSSEWVELYNPSSSPINVSQWTIQSKTGVADTFPTVSSIPANGYGVIVAAITNVSVPGGVVKIQLSSPIGDGLVTSNDKLILRDSSNNIVDQLSWGANHDIFNPGPNGSSGITTLARHPNGNDSNLATDWISNASATLGGANP